MKLRSGRDGGSSNPVPTPLTTPKTISRVRKAKAIRKPSLRKIRSTHHHKTQVQKHKARETDTTSSITGIDKSLTRDHPWRPCNPWKSRTKFEYDVAKYEADCKDGKDKFGLPARNWYRRFFTPKGEVFPPQGLLSYKGDSTDRETLEESHPRGYFESSYPPLSLGHSDFPEARKFRDVSQDEHVHSPGMNALEEKECKEYFRYQQSDLIALHELRPVIYMGFTMVDLALEKIGGIESTDKHVDYLDLVVRIANEVSRKAEARRMEMRERTVRLKRWSNMGK